LRTYTAVPAYLNSFDGRICTVSEIIPLRQPKERTGEEIAKVKDTLPVDAEKSGGQLWAIESFKT
jgi:hypothetical protein